MASSSRTFPLPRRSATSPIPRPSGADPQPEVLYNLPSARIVQFQTSGSISKRTSSSGDSPLAGEEAGTLSWGSRFERTIAIGMGSYRSSWYKHRWFCIAVFILDLWIRTSCYLRDAHSGGNGVWRFKSRMLQDL